MKTTLSSLFCIQKIHLSGYFTSSVVLLLMIPLGIIYPIVLYYSTIAFLSCICVCGVETWVKNYEKLYKPKKLYGIVI